MNCTIFADDVVLLIFGQVKEEDDLSFDQKLQLHLNRRRRRKRIEQVKSACFLTLNF